MDRKLGGSVGSCPEISENIMFYWNAYQDLATERPTGGYFSIPFFKIKQYADIFKSDLETLKLIIWAIDSRYLKHCKVKAEQEAKDRAARAKLESKSK